MPYTERDKLIHKYVTSLDNGDLEGVAFVLEAACHDPELERIVKEINLHYQEEEGITTSDSEFVRRLARKKARELCQSVLEPLVDNKLKSGKIIKFNKS